MSLNELVKGDMPARTCRLTHVCSATCIENNVALPSYPERHLSRGMSPDPIDWSDILDHICRLYRLGSATWTLWHVAPPEMVRRHSLSCAPKVGPKSSCHAGAPPRRGRHDARLRPGRTHRHRRQCHELLLDERCHGRRDEGVRSGRIVPATFFASSQGTGGGAFGVADDSTSVYQGNTAGLGDGIVEAERRSGTPRREGRTRSIV
jgi:hypothetical protein